MNTPRIIRLHESDNVLVAIDAVNVGTTHADIAAADAIPGGHKMAAPTKSSDVN